VNKVIFVAAVLLLIGSQVQAQESPVSSDINTTQIVPLSPSPTPVAVATPAPAPSPAASDIDKDADKDSHKDKHHAKKERKANFGALVSAEAHKLKSEDLNGKQKMGSWVSDQRRANDSKKADGQGAGSAASSNSDGRSANSAAPTQGQSSSHRK
jgi:hypothetical protein